MLTEPRNVLSQLRATRIASLPKIIDKDCAHDLYSKFDSFVGFVEDSGYVDDLVRVDNAVDEFVNAHPSPVVDSTVRLSMIKPKFGSYDIKAYQYFSGVSQDVGRRTEVPEPVDALWRAMEDTLSKCDRAIRNEIELPIKTLSILKIWKYTPSLGLNFLIPVHFDRSILSTIIHTKNPGIERLVFNISVFNKDIDRMSETFYNGSLFRPSPNDFPIIFPGLHANALVDLPPTAHAVEQLEPEVVGESRYSIVYFIVPYGGVGVTERYVST